MVVIKTSPGYFLEMPWEELEDDDFPGLDISELDLESLYLLDVIEVEEELGNGERHSDTGEANYSQPAG